MSSISGMERPRRREGVRNQRTRDPDPGHSKVRPLVTQPHVFRVAADRFTEAPGGQTLLITTDNVPWDLRGAGKYPRSWARGPRLSRPTST